MSAVPRIGTGAARPRLSEHALGNAIDIAAFVFDSADPLAVQPRAETGDLAEAFQSREADDILAESLQKVRIFLP